jgi:predicted acylesterase/phospholipase RssA
MSSKSIGLIMQGGGALGAYEYGAVSCLIEHGFQPTVVSGVSIGAINTAAVAGARNGDVKASLDALWKAITLPNFPFLPPDRQETLSAFGNPNFWRSRTDYPNLANWTSLCDVTPMYATLREIVDFDAINAPNPKVRMVVTATCIESGESERFSNHHPASKVGDTSAATVKKATKIGPEHILASGSLPPGFPMTQIDGNHYWDGGLFDNTPLRPLLEMLTEEEAGSLPIVTLDLFPNDGKVPANMFDAGVRQLELTYQSRFWADFGGKQGVVDYADMLTRLASAVAPEDPVRQTAQFKRMMLYKGLRNLHVVSNDSVTMTGGMDFSPYGVKRRFDDGYKMMKDHLVEHGGDLSQPDARPSRYAA